MRRRAYVALFVAALFLGMAVPAALGSLGGQESSAGGKTLIASFVGAVAELSGGGNTLYVGFSPALGAVLSGSDGSSLHYEWPAVVITSTTTSTSTTTTTATVTSTSTSTSTSTTTSTAQAPAGQSAGGCPDCQLAVISAAPFFFDGSRFNGSAPVVFTVGADSSHNVTAYGVTRDWAAQDARYLYLEPNGWQLGANATVSGIATGNSSLGFSSPGPESVELYTPGLVVINATVGFSPGGEVSTLNVPGSQHVEVEFSGNSGTATNYILGLLIIVVAIVAGYFVLRAKGWVQP